MLASATLLTALLDRAPRVRLTAAEHLGHETIIGAGIGARGDVWEPLPVLDNDRFEDVPVLRRLFYEGLFVKRFLALFIFHSYMPHWPSLMIRRSIYTH
jgi:hypothetical protein